MQITVSGIVGSGKSTISKILSKKLGYDYYSVGEFMRQIAKKRKMDINEISKMAEIDPSIDKELDDMQRALAKKDDFVMDSRLGFYFIPDSFKVYLTVDPKQAAERIMHDARSSEKYKSVKEAMEKLGRRMDSEHKRYKEYYGIDYPNKKLFDFVIDTTDQKPEEMAKKILEKIK